MISIASRNDLAVDRRRARSISRGTAELLFPSPPNQKFFSSFLSSFFFFF